MARVVTFGELMLRLAPNGYYRFFQNDQMQATFGDGEPLATFYDVHGNEYDDLYDVPLYDKQGNTYTHKDAWFTAGSYTDQNGKSYDGDYCYLSEDGYFYFDENEELKPYKDSYDYYTDGETIYYYLFNRVYLENDGTIYEKSGELHLELFDFDE